MDSSAEMRPDHPAPSPLLCGKSGQKASCIPPGKLRQLSHLLPAEDLVCALLPRIGKQGGLKLLPQELASSDAEYGT